MDANTNCEQWVSSIVADETAWFLGYRVNYTLSDEVHHTFLQGVSVSGGDPNLHALEMGLGTQEHLHLITLNVKQCGHTTLRSSE